MPITHVMTPSQAYVEWSIFELESTWVAEAFTRVATREQQDINMDSGLNYDTGKKATTRTATTRTRPTTTKIRKEEHRETQKKGNANIRGCCGHCQRMNGSAAAAATAAATVDATDDAADAATNVVTYDTTDTLLLSVFTYLG